MAYDFEKLSEVSSLDEFPEGAKVLIEHNGDIKRCAADGLGGGGGGPIPVLLATYDHDTDEYTIELEDGRTADEFAASFEKDGIATVLAIKFEEMPGVYIDYICRLYVIYDIGENEEMPQAAGGKAYMYEGETSTMLTNMDMSSMVLLDHYIWSNGL